MENYVFDEDANSEEETLEHLDPESLEEGFMEGYSEEEEVDECAECGAAITKEKKVVKAVEGEEYTFCSKECAEEFEGSLKS